MAWDIRARESSWGTSSGLTECQRSLIIYHMESHLLSIKARREAGRGFFTFALLWSAQITSMTIVLLFNGLLLYVWITSPDGFHADAFLVLIPVLPSLIALRKHLTGGTLMVLLSILLLAIAYPIGGVEGFPVFILGGMVFAIGGGLHLMVGWRERNGAREPKSQLNG